MTLGFLTYLVSGAMSSMATVADHIDKVRSISATNGALRAMKKQLAATVRDNAYWDDAYKKVNTEGGAEWAVETWGATTADYPLYDTAMVLRADGKPLMAYHLGAVMTDPHKFYLGALDDIMVAARKPDAGRDRLPVTFIKTREGIAIIGAAAIQPSAVDLHAESSAFKILVFSKQLTPGVVAEVARNFNINGLDIEETINPTRLHADVEDINEHDISFFTWPAELPGTASYLRVRPTIISAAVILIALLGAIAVAGYSAFRIVRNEERASDYRSKHDALTGVWNRAGFVELVSARLEDGSGEAICLHMLDLDGFKPVNDAWGHAVGDELIKAVATRLVECLADNAVVARLGGDEFGVICRTTPSRPTLSEDIQQALSAPFIIGGRTIEIGVSVGTSQTEPQSSDFDELLRRADLALYRAKDMGRGMSVKFHPSMDDDAGKNAELEQELRQGLANGELYVVFQPLIDSATREVSGVEALARWTSPTRGTVPPDIFIGVAEKAGLIDQLGFQVLKTAVTEGAGWPGFGVAVNVSPLQLKNPYFAGQVKDILDNAAFDPQRLTIEVTEGVLISNPDQAKRAFNALRNLGVKIALDDFGCGYASIGALREFGFDRMKIDRSLIVALDHEDRGGAVLLATIALANALHMAVTAEGIETEDQAKVVRLSGCDKLQGYLFSKPVSADEITSRYFGSAHLSLAG
jgi:diguanylate cyclase (GGDEF)-like protein